MVCGRAVGVQAQGVTSLSLSQGGGVHLAEAEILAGDKLAGGAGSAPLLTAVGSGRLAPCRPPHAMSGSKVRQV